MDSLSPDQILVAESGIATVDDARLLPARVDAVLDRDGVDARGRPEAADLGDRVDPEDARHLRRSDRLRRR